MSDRRARRERQHRPDIQSASEPATRSARDALANPTQGAPLDGATEERLGSVLGHDFSSVRIHHDMEADHLARELDARALTSGQQIYFRAGAYAPETTDGLRVLAHEAAHVAQQARGEVEATTDERGVAENDAEANEESAHAAADEVMRTSVADAAPAAHAPAPSAVVQRWPWDDDDQAKAAAAPAAPSGGSLWDTVSSVAGGIMSAAPTALSPINPVVDTASKALGGEASGLLGAGDLLGLGGLAGKISGVVGSVQSGVESGIDGAVGGITGAAKSAYGAADSAGKSIANAESGAWDAAKGAWNWVDSKYSAKNSDASKLQQQMNGGVNEKGEKEEGWVDKAENWLKQGNDKVLKSDDNSVLGSLEKASAWMGNTTVDIMGGVVKGGMDLASMGYNAMAHPIDSAVGMAGGVLSMAEHVPLIPGMNTTVKALHGAYDIATGNEKGQYGKDWGELGSHLFDPRVSANDDLNFAAGMGGGVDAWKAKPGEAAARTVTNLLPMLLGGEAAPVADTGAVAEAASEARVVSPLATEVPPPTNAGPISPLATDAPPPTTFGSAPTVAAPPIELPPATVPNPSLPFRPTLPVTPLPPIPEAPFPFPEPGINPFAKTLPGFPGPQPFDPGIVVRPGPGFEPPPATIPGGARTPTIPGLGPVFEPAPLTQPGMPTIPGVGPGRTPTIPGIPDPFIEPPPDTVPQSRPPTSSGSPSSPPAGPETVVRDPAQAILDKAREGQAWGNTPGAIEGEILGLLGKFKDPWRMPTF
jgi:hypothetical protein